MSDFVTLTCPNCGGSLRITEDIDRFACVHCNNEHVVKRGGGIVSLAPVEKQLTEIRTGVDKTASELAIKRLEVEEAQLKKDLEDLAPYYDDLIRQEGARYEKEVVEFSSLEAKEDKVHRRMTWNAVGILAVIVYAGYLWSRSPESTSIEQGQLYASTLCLLLFAIPAGLFFLVRFLMGISTSRQINAQINDLSSDMDQVREEVNESIHELRQKKQLEVQEFDKKIMRKQREIANHLNVVSTQKESNNS